MNRSFTVLLFLLLCTSQAWAGFELIKATDPLPQPDETRPAVQPGPPGNTTASELVALHQELQLTRNELGSIRATLASIQAQLLENSNKAPCSSPVVNDSSHLPSATKNSEISETTFPFQFFKNDTPAAEAAPIPDSADSSPAVPADDKL